MLNKAKTLESYKLESLNGPIGKVKEFYFDDRYWTIRYLVAETGNWLVSRQVLISPYAVTDVNGPAKSIATDLTKAQIEASPDLERDAPVSAQMESSLYGYYGWDPLWGGQCFAGGGIANVPGILMKQSEQARGTPLAGLAVKVTNGFFLIGLSAVEADMQRNVQLLKDRPWFDIPIVYTNGGRAILAMEKGPPGDRAFAEAFAAWEKK